MDLMEKIIMAIFFLIIGVAIGGLLGITSGEETIKSKAVSDGVAEYILKDGGPDTEFQWKVRP